MFKCGFCLLAGFAALVAPSIVAAADPPSGPAYQIVLHSRRAEVTPSRTKDAQTGGGWIVVEQPEINTIVITMGGSAVVGSDYCASTAQVAFDLEQNLEIIPTRPGVRPPRIGLVGRVVGTLQVTEPCHCHHPCGTAEQGPATAALLCGDTHLLAVTVPPSAASCGHESSLNNRDGPVECPAAPGCYRLTGTFHLGVSQGMGVWNRQFAVADFDPAPLLDAFWSDALKPFRAVPRREFGFKILLRVIEDPTPKLPE